MAAGSVRPDQFEPESDSDVSGEKDQGENFSIYIITQSIFFFNRLYNIDLLSALILLLLFVLWHWGQNWGFKTLTMYSYNIIGQKAFKSMQISSLFYKFFSLLKTWHQQHQCNLTIDSSGRGMAVVRCTLKSDFQTEAHTFNCRLFHSAFKLYSQFMFSKPSLNVVSAACCLVYQISQKEADHMPL